MGIVAVDTRPQDRTDDLFAMLWSSIIERGILLSMAESSCEQVGSLEMTSTNFDNLGGLWRQYLLPVIEKAM